MIILRSLSNRIARKSAVKIVHKQARIALTEQLSERIEDPICRARLADDFVKQDFEDDKQDIGTLNRTLTKQVFRLPRAV